MKRWIISAVTVIGILVSTVGAQVNQVWVTPTPEYSQAGRYINYSVQCFIGSVGLKGIHIDLDLNPTVASLVVDSIRLGDMFVVDDSITFFYPYITDDSTRLTVDIAVLKGSATVSGAGNLFHFTLFTKTFGEENIAFGGLELRNRFNEPIPASSLDAYLKVCQFVGDVNADNAVDITDLIFLVDWSFYDGPMPTPVAAGDCDCNGMNDVADLVAFVDYMFEYGTLCGPCID